MCLGAYRVPGILGAGVTCEKIGLAPALAVYDQVVQVDQGGQRSDTGRVAAVGTGEVRGREWPCVRPDFTWGLRLFPQEVTGARFTGAVRWVKGGVRRAFQAEGTAYGKPRGQWSLGFKDERARAARTEGPHSPGKAPGPGHVRPGPSGRHGKPRKGLQRGVTRPSFPFERLTLAAAWAGVGAGVCERLGPGWLLGLGPGWWERGRGCGGRAGSGWL